MTAGKIYFDMDGVLADFDRGVQELCFMKATSQTEDEDEVYDDRMWTEVRKVEHFYDRLELMPGAKEMFDAVRAKYGDRCEILTGIPRPERGILTAGADKTAWTRRLLSPDVRMNIVLRKEKAQYCTGPDCVLIDDRKDTIREWEARGGTGILHFSTEKTMKALKELGIL